MTTEVLMRDIEVILRILEILEEMQQYTNCKITTNNKLIQLRSELEMLQNNSGNSSGS